MYPDLSNFSSLQTPSDIKMNPYELAKSEYSPIFLCTITSRAVANVLLRRLICEEIQDNLHVSCITFCHKAPGGSL